MAIGDVFKVSVIGRTPLQGLLVNTFHYRALDETIFDTQVEDMVQAFHLGVNGPWTTFLACFGNSIGVDKIEAREVSGAALAYAEMSLTETGTGGAGDHLPPQCAAVLSWRTGNIGRSMRGRSYIWPTLENNQASGQWTSGYIATLQAFAAAALEIGNGTTTAHYEMVVWSTVHDGVIRPVPVSTPVVSVKVDPFVRTQRRRVQGVGA